MEFEAVIGLEIHMKLKTKSKMFCGCNNDVFTLSPNQAICPVCMGYPGTLPVVNQEAVNSATRFGLAVHGKINEYTKFDRKNYFYPDLPKGYQISQFDLPICVGGEVEFFVEGALKKAKLTRIHMEEDAGKLVHEHGNTYVDLNRAGTPLVEIVTEPDFRSAIEVSSFLKELQLIARYLNVSNADMEKGEMRCDVNVSVRPVGQKEYGTRAEVKNMNSFSAVERAIAYEIKRQVGEIEQGHKIVQETRGWDDVKGISESQRGKEEAHDYRYFPEPDLPPLYIEQSRIDELKKTLPKLPSEVRVRYHEEYSLKEDDARILATDVALSMYFEEVVKLSNDPAKAANIILSVLLYHLKQDNKPITETKVTPSQVAELINLVNAQELSMSALKIVLEELYATGGGVAEIIEAKGLKQVSDTGAIEKIVTEVLTENQQLVADYKAGKTKVFGSFVGLVMKKSGGKVNPGVVNEVLQKLLQK